MLVPREDGTRSDTARRSRGWLWVIPVVGLLWSPVLISLIRPIEATLGNQTVELLTLPENELEFVPNQGFNYEVRHARVGRYGQCRAWTLRMGNWAYAVRWWNWR